MTLPDFITQALNAPKPTYYWQLVLTPDKKACHLSFHRPGKTDDYFLYGPDQVTDLTHNLLNMRDAMTGARPRPKPTTARAARYHFYFGWLAACATIYAGHRFGWFVGL